MPLSVIVYFDIVARFVITRVAAAEYGRAPNTVSARDPPRRPFACFFLAQIRVRGRSRARCLSNRERRTPAGTTNPVLSIRQHLVERGPFLSNLNKIKKVERHFFENQKFKTVYFFKQRSREKLRRLRERTGRKKSRREEKNKLSGKCS